MSIASLVPDQPALPCVGKMAFDTAKQAEAAAVVAEHQRGIKLSWYRCQHCGLGHLSSANI